MSARIVIDGEKFARDLKAATVEHLRAKAPEVAIIVEGQVKRRFDRGGDEELRWPDLWVNQPAKVAEVTRGGRADKKRDQVKRNAERQLARIDRDEKDGKIGKAEARRKRRRAEAKSKQASEIARAGTTNLHRGGGQPLRDRGLLQASFRSRTEPTEDGARVIVGSPLEKAEWHQIGFSTSGPNYIPLTSKAQRGWNEKLVPGYDYVVFRRGVTVPARPMVRFTDQDKADIRRSIEIGG